MLLRGKKYSLKSEREVETKYHSSFFHFNFLSAMSYFFFFPLRSFSSWIVASVTRGSLRSVGILNNSFVHISVASLIRTVIYRANCEYNNI